MRLHLQEGVASAGEEDERGAENGEEESREAHNWSGGIHLCREVVPGLCSQRKALGGSRTVTPPLSLAFFKITSVLIAVKIHADILIQSCSASEHQMPGLM
jgi:hypothetical protein